MRFITSAQWGANPSKDATADSHPIGSTLGVTLHWEGPHMGAFDHDQCDDKVRGIERFHEYGRGWGDIAYNLLVCPHGYVYEGRGAGVRSAANGDTRTNEDWYAVCYLGGEGDGFTADGKQGMKDAVDYLRREGNAGPRVNGHRDHKATSCPGDAIYAWLNRENFTTARHDTTTPQETDDMPSPRDFLNEPLNQHDPKGRVETQNVSVREALTALVILADQLGGPAKAFLDHARTTPADKE